MKIKIVSDSSSNIYTFSDVNYENVPLKIITSEKEYEDTLDLNLESMLDELQAYKGKSGTSCPNIHDWLQSFEGYDVIYAVTITSGLSGSYTACMQAATDYMEEHPNTKVYVFDSLSAGPELGLIIEKLKECVLTGKSPEETEVIVREYQKHTHLVFTLESLTNLARNGRVNPAVAKLAGVLGIRIVGKASDEGTLEPLHKCRGEKKALQSLLSEMKAHGFTGGNVRISHCYGEPSANKIKDMLLAEYPDCKIIIEPCSALCSFYAERGGMLIGFEDTKS